MSKVFISAVIEADINPVWKLVREFNGFPKWHPAVVRSEIEDGREEDAVGCVRSFELNNGAWIRERLCALDDTAHSVSYTILRAPLAVTHYHASLALMPITEGDPATLAVWQAEFRCAADEESRLVVEIEDLFKAGLAALQSVFGRPKAQAGQTPALMTGGGR
ncbi:SRPBCC family protein [Aquabacterium sp.]|uniref:SRPBCC family protein n=1 Tax=Aquabacterium sp. TaxID=1872578 RepID=UPI003D6CD4ED